MTKEKLLKTLKKIGAVLTLAVMSTNSLGASADEVSNAFATAIFETIDDPKYQDYLLEALNELPTPVLQFLSLRKSKVVILNDEKGAENKYSEIFKQSPPNSIMGFADRDLRSVFVEGGNHDGYYKKYAASSQGFTEEEFNKIIVKSKLYHEIGHLLDSYTFYKSQLDEFSNVFKEEMNNFMKTREFLIASFRVKENINTSLEYFASAFSCYMSYPEDLKECCPKTYAFMEEYVKSIELRVESYHRR